MFEVNSSLRGRRLGAAVLLAVVMATTVISISGCRLFNQGTVSQAPARGAGY